MTRMSIFLAALFLLGACGTDEQSAAPVADKPASIEAFDYASVFVQDDRPEGDYADYNLRKSADVLAFTGMQPGMTVLELEAGSGFYTELFSRVVGAGGKVYMQNPAEFDSFLGEAVETRLAGGRLANVELVKTPFDKLGAVPDGSADMVTWFLGPHEMWYTPDGAEPGAFGDPDRVYAEIARVLKPGGKLIILDHKAPIGSPAETGGQTHRIDPAIVIAFARAHGLKVVAQSDLLANAEDDRTLLVFDPAVRRKTDRFLIKFEK